VVFETSVVLVVDDIASNRLLIRETLSRAGLEILEADNGQQGVIFAEKFHPDAILTKSRP